MEVSNDQTSFFYGDDSLGITFILLALGVSGLLFALFYKFYWSKKIDYDETVALLRSKGIGDKPENIVKRYYKVKSSDILTESRVRKLTKEFMQNDKDFFVTMWENSKE